MRRCVWGLGLLLPSSAWAQDDYFAMPLEQLLRVPIETVSRSEETLRRTPAQVLVFSGDDLRERGYRDFSELLDDLPGMDVKRVWGDKYLSVVWRGFRQTLGTPFLLLVDGQRMMQLYYADAEVMAALPLSNIERVEIVYGPGSVAHGADAFVGIINVVTRSGCPQALDGFVALGNNDRRVLDGSLCAGRDDAALRLTVRSDRYRLDDSFVDRYVWSDPAYLARADLWGELLRLDRYGAFDSPVAHRALDLQAAFGEQQLRYQYYRLATGYGLEYPTDAVQPHALWRESDQALDWTFKHAWSAQLASTTTLRWRRSGIDPQSDFLEAYDLGGVRVLDVSHWGADSRAQEFEQTLQWHTDDDHVALSGGLRFEWQNLQKAARTEFGPTLPVGAVDIDDYPFPPDADHEPFANNRQHTRQRSLYLIGRYTLPLHGASRHDLHAGVRHDQHSQFGGQDTWRVGYVGSRDAWTWKALYGQSFQAPTPRLLYGGWQGAGSDPDLAPHTADTWELVLGRQRGARQLSASLYHVVSHGIFRSGAGGTRNAGSTEVDGLELGWRQQIELAGDRLDLWSYYTWQHAREQPDDDAPGTVAVDAVAPHKLQFGAGWTHGAHHLLLRGRVIDRRPTQPSNPAGSVAGYALFDAAWTWHVGAHTRLQIDVSNLFDRAVMQPGVYSADAGFEPGRYDGDRWLGSAGFFNSVLVQPGRQWELRLYQQW